MKKSLFVWSYLFVSYAGLFSAPIDEIAAKKMAAGFINESSTLRSNRSTDLSTAYVSKRIDGKNRYYVFNRGEKEGYIIVSGDDRTEGILAYSDNGLFDYDRAPANVKWWLAHYERQLDVLFAAPELQVNKSLRSATGNSVEPLLGNTKWDQQAPYNNLCPAFSDGTKTPAGCVATAMAQVMYHHRHPLQGTGSHSYRYKVDGVLQTISADFGSTSYKWDTMLPTYGENFTQKAGDAVATLMYHCGVSVDMQYGIVSGAYAIDIPYALYTYFGYDGGMSHKLRDYYLTTDWEELIKKELDEERPVIYVGTAPAGGHAFVCDGYDANGYFHINWGWSGMSDGYFRLDALEPEALGTGGYTGGFNYQQAIVTGIRPEMGGQATPEIYASSGPLSLDEEIAREGEMRITGTLLNGGWATAEVNIGILIYNEQNIAVDTLPCFEDAKTLQSQFYFEFTNTPFSTTFPTSLPNGTYKMYWVYQQAGNTTWQHVHTYQNDSPYLLADVSEDTVHFSTVPAEDPIAPNILVKEEGSTFQTSLTQYAAFTQNIVVENKGLSLNNKFYLILINRLMGSIVYLSEGTNVVVPQGESKTTINVSGNIGNVPAGTYFMIFGYEDKGVVQLASVDNTTGYLTAKVTANPEAAPVLSISKADTHITTLYPQNDFTFATTIHNTGGEFSGDLYLTLANENGIFNYISEAGNVQVSKDKEAEFSVTGNVGQLTAGTYYLGIVYLERGLNAKYVPFDNGEETMRVDVLPVSGIDERTHDISIELYPNPITDYVIVNSKAGIKSLRLYSLQGTLLQEQACDGKQECYLKTSQTQGVYLLSVDTAEGQHTERIIIKQ